MPYVNIQVTKEGGPDGTGPSKEEKAALIKGVTGVLHDVLGKDPAKTFVVIEEVDLDNWGCGGLQVREYRALKAKG
ncbi:tautomerase family protein [Woodsholea maritima]|uniref:tautomerase family protein n=1 Tax=Woodsholea maritima TaxID=240237 RepID=UPI0003783F89|nr:4-oxalocrotonate tautomerase family protein [Woodsholea maritima]